MKDSNDFEQRFLQVLKSKGNDTYTLELTGSEATNLHCLVTLATDHPIMQKMEQGTHCVADKIRQWCKGVWVNMGISEEESDFLDQLREQICDYPHRIG